MAVAFILPGCGTTSSAPSTQARPAPALELRIQVCYPTQRIYFDDLKLERLENHPQFTNYSRHELEQAPKTIRRVARSSDPRVASESRTIREYGISFGTVMRQSGQRSYGTAWMSLSGSTRSDQPIYDSGRYGRPANEYVAMSVRLRPASADSASAEPTFWFTLPKSLPSDGFTDWFAPASMESTSPGGSSGAWWYRLAHGGDLPIRPIAAEPPKMRVALVKPRYSHTDPRVDTLPALTTARMTLKTPTSDPQFVYEFVEKTNEATPPCD